MRFQLGVGDRELVKDVSCVPGYHSGEKGTVLRTAPPAATGTTDFMVAMDKHRRGTPGVVSAEQEIELAV
jgi:hypothetical protein